MCFVRKNPENATLRNGAKKDNGKLMQTNSVEFYRFPVLLDTIHAAF
jgi:hypothetical protein